MTSVNISLPINQRQYVERKVSRDGYSTVSEYFRELVRQDEQREAEARLDSLLLRAMESGGPTPMTRKDWDDIGMTSARKSNNVSKGAKKESQKDEPHLEATPG